MDVLYCIVEYLWKKIEKLLSQMYKVVSFGYDRL